MNAPATFGDLCLRLVREHDAHMADLDRVEREFDAWADSCDSLDERVTDLRAQQVRWDAEHETIERGLASFIPERPEGEPSMLAGTVFTITMLVLLVAGFQILEWIIQS